MKSKDKLQELKNLSKAAGNTKILSEKTPPLSSSTKNSIKTMSLIEDHLNDIDSSNQKLGKLYKQLNDEADDSRIKEIELNIRKLTDKIIKDSKGIQEAISTHNDEISSAKCSKQFFNCQKIKIQSSRKKLQSLLIEFSTIQSKAAEANQSAIKRQYKIIDPKATEKEVHELVQEIGSMRIGKGELFALSQTDDALERLKSLKKRRKTAMLIEENIQCLSDLSNQLALMIDEQGERIDEIEEYYDDIIESTFQAVEGIDEAAEVQKSTRRLHCSLL